MIRQAGREDWNLNRLANGAWVGVGAGRNKSKCGTPESVGL